MLPHDNNVIVAMSSSENSQISMSKSDSVAEKGISAVDMIQGQDKSKKQANNRCILSERALQALEVAILTLVVVCVVGLLSLPSLLYFVKKVSETDDVTCSVVYERQNTGCPFYLLQTNSCSHTTLQNRT